MGFDPVRYSALQPISWEQLHWDTKQLCRRLHDLDREWGRLIVVTRGGLTPAAVVARELDMHYIDTVCISSYHFQEQGQTQVLKAVDGPGDDCLVIDDLVDSGKTARAVREMLPEAHIASVYAKTPGRPFVDTFVREFDADMWVLFPWDSGLRFVSPLVEGD